jgi:hypothetical protein
MPMVYFAVAFTLLLAGLALGFYLAERWVRAVLQTRHDREMAKARGEAELLRTQLRQADVALYRLSELLTTGSTRVDLPAQATIIAAIGRQIEVLKGP